MMMHLIPVSSAFPAVDNNIASPLEEFETRSQGQFGRSAATLDKGH
jgi:hypothetical protein